MADYVWKSGILFPLHLLGKVIRLSYVVKIWLLGERRCSGIITKKRRQGMGEGQRSGTGGGGN